MTMVTARALLNVHSQQLPFDVMEAGALLLPLFFTQYIMSIHCSYNQSSFLIAGQSVTAGYLIFSCPITLSTSLKLCYNYALAWVYGLYAARIVYMASDETIIDRVIDFCAGFMLEMTIKNTMYNYNLEMKVKMSTLKPPSSYWHQFEAQLWQ